jgi:hypothetical protein
VPSEGFRIDLSGFVRRVWGGFVRRVWGSGLSGELRLGVQDCAMAFVLGILHSCSSKLTLFRALAQLEGMSISEDGDCSGVLGDLFATLSRGGIGFSPKGSWRNSTVSSAAASSWSLGGVGGRTERDSNLDDTMAMLKTANKTREQK